MPDKKRDDANMTRSEFNKARRKANKIIKKNTGSGKNYRKNKIRRSDFGDISIPQGNSNTQDPNISYDENQEFGNGGKMKNNRYNNGGIIQHD